MMLYHYCDSNHGEEIKVEAPPLIYHYVSKFKNDLVNHVLARHSEIVNMM